MFTIGVIDIQIGNTFSLLSALTRAGYQADLIQDPKDLKERDLIILPGVGAFPYAMEQLRNSGFDAALKERHNSGRALMGVCLGMQLLYETGFEMVETPGLGLLQGQIQALPPTLRSPHMGWNALIPERSDPLTKGLTTQSAVYFVHSYYAAADAPETRLATCKYSAVIPAIVRSGNTVGFQFHPEKSGEAGAHLLQNLKEAF